LFTACPNHRPDKEGIKTSPRSSVSKQARPKPSP